jgi:hypothetical protein
VSRQLPGILAAGFIVLASGCAGGDDEPRAAQTSTPEPALYSLETVQACLEGLDVSIGPEVDAVADDARGGAFHATFPDTLHIAIFAFGETESEAEALRLAAYSIAEAVGGRKDRIVLRRNLLHYWGFAEGDTVSFFERDGLEALPEERELVESCIAEPAG